MNYQMHFDPYQIEHLKQRHEELLQEMQALRLEERMREKRTGYAWRFAALIPRLRSYLAKVCKLARRHPEIAEEFRSCHTTEAKDYC
jgi:hypothetical protein